MYGKSVKINHWLIPVSWLYGLGVEIRNKLFDWGILPAEEFDIPVISVGNLAVGGTGKTPHIEYLIELLGHKYHIAVLSRGYKRKSRGFILADDKSTAREIGDEPYQIKRKYPNITVAVDANRRRGIKQLKKQIKEITKKLKQFNYIEEELSEKVEQNIDFAKRHLVDTIYKQAILEGVATTFADTESIIEGGKVNNMTSEDIIKIVNLKHAWEFILNKNVILSDTNFALLCEINKMVEEGFYYTAGKVRNTPVTIGGTTWKPDLPIESVIREELEEILSKELNDIDKAIELLLYTMKKQVFIDGNKRTAVIYSNHYLISKGKGIIAIPAELTEEFKDLLIPYYEGRDEKEIKKFIKEQCYMRI